MHCSVIIEDDDKTKKMKVTTTTTTPSIDSKRLQLLQLSNWASLFCMLDCTLLPLVTVILPLLGLVTWSPTALHRLHLLGHRVALWFVIPVGTLATWLNYSQHRQLPIALLGSIGLIMVFSANCDATYDIMHALHEGPAHNVCNLMGCAMLLSSNYLSRSWQSGCCELPGCKNKTNLLFNHSGSLFKTRSQAVH